MDSIVLSDYRHRIEVAVRFMDIDALQHVNNARYLNFLEEARIAYSQELLGIFNNIKELNVLVARVEIDYLRPILYGNSVYVYTRISKVGNKSFVFDSVVTTLVDEEEKIAARALQTLVAFDMVTGKSTPIPSDLKQQIVELEPYLS